MSESENGNRRVFWDYCRPLREGRPTRDRYAKWSLGGGAHLLFVADAPNAALVETGRLIEVAIGGFLEEKAEPIGRFLAEADANECRYLLSDLGTWLNDELRRKEGETYAACLLCLVTPEGVAALCVGDCALYVGAGARRYRLSDSTRLGGGFITGLMSGNHSPVHYAEGVYLGAQPRAFRQEEVMCVRRAGQDAVVLLATDGAESHFGSDALAKTVDFTLDHGGVTAGLAKGLIDLASEREALDDVSVQMLYLPATEIGERGSAGLERTARKESCDDSPTLSSPAAPGESPSLEKRIEAMEASVAVLREGKKGDEAMSGETGTPHNWQNPVRLFAGRSLAIFLLIGVCLFLTALLVGVIWLILMHPDWFPLPLR